MPRSSLDIKYKTKNSVDNVGQGQAAAGHKSSKQPPALFYQEQQNDELEVLRSVYPEDFTEIETRGAWAGSAEKSFRLALCSSLNASYNISLTVTFTATYPKTIPILTLDGVEGLEPKVTARLRDVVSRRPNELLGEVMILELTNELRDILEDAAEARIMGKALPSLEEERALVEARIAQEQRVADLEAERKRQSEKAEEERTMQLMVEEEAKRRETLRKKRDSEGEGLSQVEKYNADDVVFDQKAIINNVGGQSTSFRAVTVLRQIGQGTLTRVFEVRSRTPSNTNASEMQAAETSVFLALKRVALRRSGVKKLLLDIEDELDKLKTLRNDNIVNVLNFKISRTDDSWSFDILTELANTRSLADLLDTTDRLPVHRARSFSINILHALDFYHKNGIVHGLVHLGNILLCKSATGNTALKLADAGFQIQLHALQSGVKPGRHGSDDLGTAWVPPEITPSERFFKSRKTDVFEFGVVLVQMLLGVDVTDTYTTASGFLNSARLTGPFHDLMRDVLRQDPRKRSSAFDLVPFEFFRTDCGAVQDIRSRSGTDAASRRRSFHHSNSAEEDPVSQSASRYGNEWDESGRLGKGGFGEVVKARNKLDGRIYAVKKITGKTPAQLSEVLSEVYLLATLNHPYVVRYYTAWPENETPVGPDFNSTAASSSDSEVLQTRMSSRMPGSSESLFAYGQSTGGIDFISSSGFPQEDDSEVEDEDEDYDREETNKSDVEGDDIFDRAGTEPSFHTQSSQKPTGTSLARTRGLVKATLYIQMEYCEKLTLRDIICKDINDNSEMIWTLLRQILEGLVHVHEHGIIHRDLKPENIFIDSANNPKIGDFGLATTGNIHPSQSATSSKIMSSEMTRSIGTAMYVAPELRSTSTGTYTAQVDMYSLGVILFEMCFPLRTAMERVHTLAALRQKEHKLPPEFSATTDKQAQGDIIECLVKHKASERPSSIELLRGGKLPIQIEDEQIRHALSSLSDPSSPYYHRMMNALFAPNVNRQVIDRMWDVDRSDLVSADALDYLLLQSIVKTKLLSVFRRYGAVEVPRQGLIPRSELYTRSDVAQYLDPSGLVQLPYDLVLPHARSIAKQDHVPERSFTFGNVFRESPSGGAPRSNREADFDIVSYTNKDLAIAEAEVIECLDDVLHGFPCFTRVAMCFHVSHSGLLDVILEFCRVAEPQRSDTKEVLGKLNIGHWTWQKIRSELRSSAIGVASTSLDDLMQFDFRDTPEKSFSRLQAIFAGTTYMTKVETILNHVSELFEYLKRLNVRRNVYFSPLSNFNFRFYRDAIMFQCLFDSKKRDILAAGGRYDSLIEDQRPSTTGTSSRTRARGVGSSIAWDRIVSAMIRFQKQAGTNFLRTSEEPDISGHWILRRCDALVASFDSALLRSAGVKLVSKLRSLDISAELAVDTWAPEELLAHYRDDRHSWIIIIKHEADPNNKPELKVRNMDKKGESTDIRTSELLSYMRAELRERNQRDGTAHRTKLFRHTSSHSEETTYNTERKGDVRVLLARQGNKPGNKRPFKARLIEEAQTKVKDLLSSYADGPIASIETRDEILLQIRNTRFSDWKSLDQEVPVADRQYVHELYDLLSQFKSKQDREISRKCFIYNFKTGMCIDYDLWL